MATAPTALATNVPILLYDPPKILFTDLPADDSSENVTAVKAGGDFEITNTPGGVALDGDSQAGCDAIAGGYACAVAGVRKMTFKLGMLPDSIDIDLGSKADAVKQKVDGGPGEDELNGGSGKQTLKGGDGIDALTGGPGRDVLKGGPGDDVCDGGPGRDKLRSCEGTFPG